MARKKRHDANATTSPALLARQKEAIIEHIFGGEFYECLMPYELPDFYYNDLDVTSFELGRICFDFHEVSTEGIILPGHLFTVTWKNSVCTWDPIELDSLKRGARLKSIQFDLNLEDPVFGKVDVTTLADDDPLKASLESYASGKLVDYCLYDLENDRAELTKLIDEQPMTLRAGIRKLCEQGIAKWEKDNPTR